MDRFRDVLYWYEDQYGRSLASAFQRLASRGRLELMTCAGTHGFLPILKANPAAVRAQVYAAADDIVAGDLAVHDYMSDDSCPALTF